MHKYVKNLALLAVSLMPAVAAHAMVGIPASGDLEFTVLRDGSEVGSHVIRFHNAGDEVKVDVETHVNVKLPLIGISVYHFEHAGQEVWRGGELIALKSTTDDDGEAKAVKVWRDGDVLHVESRDEEHRSSGGLLPASLWHPELVHHSVLLNTLDGHEMQVTVTDQGKDDVNVHGRTVSARHVLVSGGLNRELWYDANGVLVKVSFAAKDDSRIEYVLK